MWYIHKILLIMRLTTVILIATMMQVSASSFGQRITLNTKNATLDKVIKDIRKQSGYDFLYSESLIKSTKRISITVKDASIEEVLEKCLSNQNVSYKIENNTVLLRVKEPSFLDRIMDHFATVDVRGRVLDEAGNPLVGATIQVKGKAQAYKTNDKGEFEIKGVDEDAVLLVSYVGFRTLEIALKGAVMPLEIKLNVATGELEEVKVVYNTGYQELNLKNTTGSVVQIDNELFNRQVGSNVLERIYNITSGLLSIKVQNSNVNTPPESIVIRGKSTLRGASEPLIVVDNFPYEGAISSLNPNDIESITVLKDANSAAIWGTRAGNGVIVITTKRAKFNSRPNISLNSNITIKPKPNLEYIPSLSSADMVEFEKQRFSTGMYNNYDDLYPSIKFFPVLPLSIEILLAARKQNKGTPGYNALNDPRVITQLDEMGKNDVRRDLKKYMMQNGTLQTHALNISGGTTKFSYNGSIGYDGNRSEAVKNSGNRTTLNWKTFYKPLENLEIGGSIMYSIGKSYQPQIDYRQLLNTPGNSPYAQLIDGQNTHLAIPKDYRKSYVDTASFPALRDWHYRPLDEIDLANAKTESYDTRINTNIKYNILPWLSAELQYQGQLNINQGVQNYSANSFFVRNGINSLMQLNNSGQLIYPWPEGDYVAMIDGKQKSWNVRSSLAVNKAWDNSQLIGLIGMEFREFTNDTRFSKMYGYDPNTNTFKDVNPTQSFPARPNGSRQLVTSSNPLGTIGRLGSIFSIVSYSLFDKYIISSSARIDQSNNFGLKANLKRIPLWSVGLGWNLDKEEWYSVNWLNTMKIRASYGYTGNTIFGATSFATFKYQTANSQVPNRGNLIFGDILTPNNPGLSWEKTKIINTGVDFSLFKGRIRGSADYYVKNGLDLMGDVKSDPSSGFLVFTGNSADTKGKGLDLNLNTINISTKDFQWQTKFLFSYSKTKVSRYYSASKPSAFNMISGNYQEGYPPSSLFSYTWAGLDPLNGDPRVYLGDTISNFSLLPKANVIDAKYRGPQTPIVFGSFMNDVSWKGISLSFNITYRFGYYFRRSSINYNQLLDAGWNTHIDYSKRWQKNGDEVNTDIPSLPRFSNATRDQAYLLSDAVVEKGDHVRLQDIRLAYSI